MKHTVNPQQGFGVVMALLIVAAISLLGFGGYYVYSQNTDGKTDRATETTQSDNSKSMTSLNISRRDTQRKNDVGLLLARSESFAGNNNGSYPTALEVKTRVIDTYIDEDFVDPLLEIEYVIVSDTEPQVGEIQYELGVSCSENDGFTTESNERYLAARTLLENGKFFCQDNR